MSIKDRKSCRDTIFGDESLVKSSDTIEFQKFLNDNVAKYLQGTVFPKLLGTNFGNQVGKATLS